MPRLKTCTGCGTPFPAAHRGGRCPDCRPTGNANRSPTTRARRDGTGDYERNRLAILSDAPACALRIRCDGAPATTVDHIVPASQGGGHDRSNLQPACAPCNYSRQARTSTHAAPPRAPNPPRPLGTRLA